MENLVVTETSGAALEAASAATRALDAAGVSTVMTFTSRDGARRLLVHEGGDLATVKQAFEAAGIRLDGAYDARCVISPGAGQNGDIVTVAERAFDPHMTPEALLAFGDEKSWCMELYNVAHECSLLADDGSVGFCVYTAADHESVRNANRRMDAPTRALWQGTWVGAASLPQAARSESA